MESDDIIPQVAPVKNKGGRPRKNPLPPVAPVKAVEAVAVSASMSADASLAVKTPLDERQAYQAEIERIRKTRKPFGAMTQKLALATRPGYHRHWFNDTPGRIDEAVQSGWTHVKGKDGQPIKRVVGMSRESGGLHAFAMEIPSVFWEEDQQAQFERAEAPIREIKSSPFRAKEGQSRPSDNSKFYSPREQAVEIERK